jgi:ankyrin repeat protein
METPPSSPLTHLTASLSVSSNNDLQSPPLAISYTPEKYGNWETFTHHPDFIIAVTQYIDLFAKITHFIDQHCQHSQSLHSIFADFLHGIQAGRFESREIFLYGANKLIFETFCQLLDHADIPLNKKISAIKRLAREINTWGDEGMNSLSLIIRQLHHVTAGPYEEAVRIQTQLIEQWVQEFCRPFVDNEAMEKHHIALYLHFLKTHYTLFLESDLQDNALSLGVTQGDLHACLQYIKDQLTPYSVPALMAKAYLAELHKAIPATGAGLTYSEAKTRLVCLKTKLTPTYGDIPEGCLLKEINGRYYASPQATVIQVMLIQNLQACNFVSYQIHSLYQYLTPSVIRDPIHHDIPLPQRVEGKTLHICHTGPLYFVQMDGEPFPTLLNLSHLIPLVKDLTLPVALMQEAIHNTSAAEVEQWKPVWIHHPNFFNAYLCSRFLGREEQLEEIIMHMFNQPVLEEACARLAFQHLGFNASFTTSYLQKHLLEKVFWTLAKTLEKCIEKRSVSIIHNETILQNLLIAGFNAKIKDNWRNTLLMTAAYKGWLQSIDHLLWLGVNINALNAYNWTAVMHAAAAGQLEIVKKLCFAGANLTLKSREKQSGLTYAIINKQLAIAEFLLTFQQETLAHISPASGRHRCDDINARDSEGMTPLLRLFQEQEVTTDTPHIVEPAPDIFQRILALLLKYNADVYIRDKQGFSILAYQKTLTTGCFDQLLAAGANPYGQDSSTILLNTIKHNQYDTLLTLLRMGVAVHTPQDRQTGYCLIKEVISQRKWQMAKLLLQYGQETLTPFSRFNALYLIVEQMLAAILPKAEGKTLILAILHPAFFYPETIAQQSCFDGLLQFLQTFEDELRVDYVLAMLHLLIINKIDMHLLMNNGDTLLMHLVKSRWSNHKKFAPLLAYLAKRTDLLDIQDEKGNTPFTQAVQNGDIHAMNLFWEANPNIIHIQDAQGRTPFQLATQHQQGVAMNWLMVKGADVSLYNADEVKPMT